MILVGLTVVAVMSGSSLINSATIATLRMASQNSIVNSTEDLTLWMDVSSRDSFVNDNPANGDSIAVWKDVNPQLKNKITFNSSFTAPIYTTSSTGPSLKFNSNANFSSSAVSGTRFVRSDQMTAFVVQKYQPTVNGAAFIWGNVAFSNIQVIPGYQNTLGELRFVFGDSINGITHDVPAINEANINRLENHLIYKKA